MSSEDTIKNWAARGDQIRRRAISRQNTITVAAFVALLAFLVCQFAVGIILLGGIPETIPETIRNSAGAVTIAFVLTQIAALRMARITAYRVTGQVIPFWMMVFVLAVGSQLLLRFEYGFWFTALSFFVGTVILAVFAHHVTFRDSYKVGVPHTLLPLDAAHGLDAAAFVPLPSPDLPDQSLDIIAISDTHLNDPDWTPFLSWCAINAVPVVMLRDYIERQTGKVDLEHFELGDALRLVSSTSYLSLKRVLDIAFCGLLLILLLPFLVLIALFIRLESPGPALFVQKRIGRGGNRFTMFKFRSMRSDAEASGAKFAASDDPRITRIGRFIRKMRIDELPQLFNVVRGDMSFIGPRPEQENILDDLVREIPLFPLRHAVRPGITGWAQVCQGYADDVATSREKVAHDLFYIRNVSFLLDMNIVIRTVRIIFSGFGAR